MTQNVWQPWDDALIYLAKVYFSVPVFSAISDTLSRSGGITGCLSCCVLNESSWCIRSCLSSHQSSGWPVLLFAKRQSKAESFNRSRGRSTTPNHPSTQSSTPVCFVNWECCHSESTQNSFWDDRAQAHRSCHKGHVWLKIKKVTIWCFRCV